MKNSLRIVRKFQINGKSVSLIIYRKFIKPDLKGVKLYNLYTTEYKYQSY